MLNWSIKGERYEVKVERARKVWERVYWDALGCGGSDTEATTIAKQASDRVMVGR